MPVESLRRITAASLVCCAAAIGQLSAQETITSDRPGIGSGSAAVTRGVVQLEAGVSYSSVPFGHSYQLGESLVRIGLSGLELEVFGNSFVISRSDFGGTGTEGIQDGGLGVKVPLPVESDGASLAVQGILTLPTGSDAYTSDEWLTTLNGLLDVSMNERLSVSVNVGYQTGSGAIPGAWTVILTPGVALDGGVGLYGGWVGGFSEGGDTSWAEGGLTYLVNPDMQLDVNSGWSLDDEAWFLGVGVAIRRGPR